ncbi:unnamed protein product, partial [Effrenium voratum]
DAADGPALRVRLAVLEQEIPVAQREMDDLRVVNAMVTADLAEANLRCKKLEEAMRRWRVSDDCFDLGRMLPSPVAAVWRSFSFLEPAEICGLDASCRYLHAKLESAGAWQALCLRNLPAERCSSCWNFKAALLHHRLTLAMEELTVSQAIKVHELQDEI